MTKPARRTALCLALFAAALGWQAPVLAAPAPQAAAAPASRHPKGDPLEGLNRGLFNAQGGLDRAIFRPIALGYKHVVPKFLRLGIRHFLRNLSEPVVFLNDVLQLKPKRAAKTFERFAINSTLGVGGVIDVAKHEKIPYRKNGFGNTLARYGVGPGPYLYLPFIGPTTLRDALASPADGAVLPVIVGKPFDQAEYQIPTAIVSALDERAQADEELKALLSTAVDPYATLRSVYLQNRAAEVREIKGQAPNPGTIDPLLDPALQSPTVPAPQSPADEPDPATLPDPAPSPSPDTPPPGGGPSNAGSNISAQTSVQASDSIRILPMLAVPRWCENQSAPNAVPVASAENSTARARLDCSRSRAPALQAMTK